MNINEVLEERETTHGDFAEVAKIDQALKAILKSSPNWAYLSDRQKLSLEMIAHKLSRIVCGDPDHPDHLVDVIGYSNLFHSPRPKGNLTQDQIREMISRNARNTTQTIEKENTDV